MATTDLPAPQLANWDWQTAAACRGMNSEAFFHPPKERNHNRRNRILSAKIVCNTCPVIQQCLNHALKVGEQYGIWGGKSEDERAEILGLRSLQYPQPEPSPSGQNWSRPADLPDAPLVPIRDPCETLRLWSGVRS